ncbi:MAG: 6-carboxytetrahydropterin synthase QueD [Saprospiraceae bacterium]|nr:6-carboxytetrahydropterin synthase QueD [Saprospiraceae bacterium]
MELFKQFTFDSAHFLPNVPEGHKCKAIHGHTYRLVVYIEGPLDPHLEWVMDFADLKHVVDPIVKTLDHHLMNDIAGLENSTGERISIWLWDQIKPQVPLMSKIELHETPTSGAVYKGI